jgi:hypothetical protein
MRNEAADNPPQTIPPFGVNEMRLSARHWLAVAAVVVATMVVVPRAWSRAERFATGPDYRIPYALSSDYWLYRRWIERIRTEGDIPIVGDSVVWGEYVRPDGTLSHFLTREAGSGVRFRNGGLNGVFPLAMEGLAARYGDGLSGRKVIVHYNMLWMSSPKADLSTPNEETFNHTQLVPQAFGAVPCYRADAATRLGVVASQSLGFFAWVNHLDAVYFDQMSLPRWTLAEDGSQPPVRPNAWRNPLARIDLRTPGEPAIDPQRGPSSPRHRPWNRSGAEPTHFEWVPVRRSLQWAAFRRTLALLRSRGCDVLVVLGPFNEHMVSPDQRPLYRGMRDEICGWLRGRRVPVVVPDTLPSELYADASHPLTGGYALLARRVAADPAFRAWLGAR